MLKKKDRTALDQIEFVSAGCLVPENHFLRAVQASIIFDFIYNEGPIGNQNRRSI